MIRNARPGAIVVMEQAVIYALASCVQPMPCIARYGPSGGNGQFMGVQRKISPVKSFPKGSHLFGGDERQAGTTTITDLQVYTRREPPPTHPTNSSCPRYVRLDTLLSLAGPRSRDKFPKSHAVWTPPRASALPSARCSRLAHMTSHGIARAPAHLQTAH